MLQKTRQQSGIVIADRAMPVESRQLTCVEVDLFDLAAVVEHSSMPKEKTSDYRRFKHRAAYGLKQQALRAAMFSMSIAWTAVAFANVIGSDTQNFNPITSGLDFVTVQSSETLQPGYVNFGLFLNQGVNTLPHYDQSTTKKRREYHDSIVGADLNVGVGLLQNWDIGLSFPQMVYQSVKDTEGNRGQFAQNGATEIRLNTKVRLWGNHNYGVALIGTAGINRIKNNPFVGENAGPNYNLELAADTTISRIAVGANIGRRWRKPGTPIEAEISPMRDQWIGSVAASYLFTSIDTKLIFEIFGSNPVNREDENSNRLNSSREALLGLKYDFTTHLAGHLGAGTELQHGRSSPDWRIYAGMNWAMGPTFAKSQESNVVRNNTATPAQFNKKDPFAGPPKALEKIVIHDVLFEFDSDTLVLTGADNTLKRLVDYLNQKPAFTRLIIEGHTDSIGSDDYNQKLSRRRADTIRNWLISKYKLDPRKITAFGKGERNPIADNGNYQGRQLNRRVEFTIYRNMK